MISHITSRKSLGKFTIMFAISLGVFLFSATPSQAATCEFVGDQWGLPLGQAIFRNSFNDKANWKNCNDSIPGAGDDILIDNKIAVLYGDDYRGRHSSITSEVSFFEVKNVTLRNGGKLVAYYGSSPAFNYPAVSAHYANTDQFHWPTGLKDGRFKINGDVTIDNGQMVFAFAAQQNTNISDDTLANGLPVEIAGNVSVKGSNSQFSLPHKGQSSIGGNFSAQGKPSEISLGHLSLRRKNQQFTSDATVVSAGKIDFFDGVKLTLGGSSKYKIFEFTDQMANPANTLTINGSASFEPYIFVNYGNVYLRDTANLTAYDLENHGAIYENPGTSITILNNYKQERGQITTKLALDGKTTFKGDVTVVGLGGAEVKATGEVIFARDKRRIQQTFSTDIPLSFKTIKLVSDPQSSFKPNLVVFSSAVPDNSEIDPNDRIISADGLSIDQGTTLTIEKGMRLVLKDSLINSGKIALTDKSTVEFSSTGQLVNAGLVTVASDRGAYIKNQSKTEIFALDGSFDGIISNANPLKTAVPGKIYVTVRDSSRNLDASKKETVSVAVTTHRQSTGAVQVLGGSSSASSNNFPDLETLTLTETSNSSGIFTNTTALPLNYLDPSVTANTPTEKSNVFEVTDTASIRALYSDETSQGSDESSGSRSVPVKKAPPAASQALITPLSSNQALQMRTSFGNRLQSLGSSDGALPQNTQAVATFSDLEVTGVTVTANPSVANQESTIEVKVKNSGQGAAGPFNVLMTLTLTDGSTASYQLRFPLGIGSGTTLGSGGNTHFKEPASKIAKVAIIIDPQGTLNEINKSNNSKEVEFTRDLQITDVIIVPNRNNPAIDHAIDVLIKNSGTGIAGEFSYTLTLLLASGQTKNFTEKISNLLPGATSQKIGRHFPGQLKKVTVALDPSNQVPESDENTNHNKEISFSFDVQPVSVVVTKNPQLPRVESDINVVIKNAGTGTVGNFYYSITATLLNNHTYSVKNTVTGLLPGATNQQLRHIPVPIDQIASVDVVIDSTNLILGEDKTNNLYNKVVTSPSPCLKISDKTACATTKDCAWSDGRGGNSDPRSAQAGEISHIEVALPTSPPGSGNLFNFGVGLQALAGQLKGTPLSTQVRAGTIGATQSGGARTQQTLPGVQTQPPACVPYEWTAKPTPANPSDDAFVTGEQVYLTWYINQTRADEISASQRATLEALGIDPDNIPENLQNLPGIVTNIIPADSQTIDMIDKAVKANQPFKSPNYRFYIKEAATGNIILQRNFNTNNTVLQVNPNTPPEQLATELADAVCRDTKDNWFCPFITIPATKLKDGNTYVWAVEASDPIAIAGNAGTQGYFPEQKFTYKTNLQPGVDLTPTAGSLKVVEQNSKLSLNFTMRNIGVSPAQSPRFKATFTLNDGSTRSINGSYRKNLGSGRSFTFNPDVAGLGIKLSDIRQVSVKLNPLSQPVEIDTTNNTISLVLNALPNKPELSKPTNKETITSLSPTLVWNDKGPTTNFFRFYIKDPDLNNQKIWERDFASGQDGTDQNCVDSNKHWTCSYATIPAGVLNYDKRYLWGVEASDGSQNSGYSAEQEFSIKSSYVPERILGAPEQTPNTPPPPVNYEYIPR